MKSYSGIPYTTGKQAADDVKTQLVGFIKIPKWAAWALSYYCFLYFVRLFLHV